MLSKCDGFWKASDSLCGYRECEARIYAFSISVSFNMQLKVAEVSMLENLNF